MTRQLLGLPHPWVTQGIQSGAGLWAGFWETGMEEALILSCESHMQSYKSIDRWWKIVMWKFSQYVITKNQFCVKCAAGLQGVCGSARPCCTGDSGLATVRTHTPLPTTASAWLPTPGNRAECLGLHECLKLQGRYWKYIFLSLRDVIWKKSFSIVFI